MKLTRLALFLCLISLCAFGQTTITATIADNQSLSASVQLGGTGASNVCTPAAIIIPSTWVTATTMTFQASLDGSTWYELHDEYGTAVSITVSASKYIRLNPSDWWGVPFLKLRSGTSGSAVQQTEDAGVAIKILCK